MAKAGSVTRVEDDVMAAAKRVAGSMSRSATQQVSHWARIGLELERDPDVTHGQIAAVLAGRHDYDLLGPKEQAIVRAEWTEALAARMETHDLRDVFAERGHGYVGLNDAGDVVHFHPDGSIKVESTATTTEREPEQADAAKAVAAASKTARKPSKGQ